MRSSGFITLGLTGYIAIGAAAVIASLTLALWIQTQRLETAHETIAAVKVKAAEQERRTKERIAADLKLKERTDAENARLRNANAALARSLRESRARGSFVPPAPSTAERPELATFDRAELERAIQRLDEGISGLIEQGDQARIDLDSAKAWAQ